MQWLATPLNALDSAIDRLATPQRGGADNDNNDDEGNSNTANAGTSGARSLVLDDDARAAAAEDDGFASSSSLDVGGNEKNAFGAQLEIGPLGAGAAVGGDDQSVTQQTIDINDAMGVISPLKNDDGGEEGAFVNGIGRHGGRSMPPSDSLVGRAPPLPLHPNTKSRGSGAAMGSVPSATAMDESQYVLETPPARIWPSQPKPQQPSIAAVDGPAADNAKPPTTQSKRSAPVSSKASSTGNTANGAGSSTAVSGISPFPGRLVKRARPPSPVNSLTEQEEAQVKTGVEGYLSSFVRGNDGDDTGNADDGGSAGAVDGSDDYMADETNEEETDQVRKAQEEAARLEAQRIEAQRVETERKRQREKEEEAERQRIAAAEEKARLELLEAKRIADAKAAAEREAAVKAEMERQLREEAARRIAEQRRVEAQRKAREEEEARRIAVAAEEEARRRKAEEDAKKNWKPRRSARQKRRQNADGPSPKNKRGLPMSRRALLPRPRQKLRDACRKQKNNDDKGKPWTKPSQIFKHRQCRHSQRQPNHLMRIWKQRVILMIPAAMMIWIASMRTTRCTFRFNHGTLR